MPSLARDPLPVRATVMQPDRRPATILVTIGAILAFVAWDQSFWWRSLSDYRFGWLAPLFVGYAVFRHWDEIGRLLAGSDMGAPGPAAGESDAGASRATNLLLRLGLGLAATLFLLGSLSRAFAGPSHPGSLALALGAAGMTLSLVALAGSSPTPPTAAHPRRRLVSLFVYPALVWLLTMPMLTAGETRASIFLLSMIEHLVLGVFHLLHLPVHLEGNVFVLRGGPVALEEACLGLRSITGCLFGGFFLAEVCLRRWRLRAWVLVAALALALIMNFVRVLFLNLWAHKFGPHAIEGTVHDSSGWLVLVATALGLFLLTTRLERRETHPPAAPPA